MDVAAHQDRILAKIIEIESRPAIDAYAKAALDGLYLLLERSESADRIAEGASDEALD